MMLRFSLFLSVALAVLSFPAGAEPHKTHYYVPQGEQGVSQRTADVVYRSVADAYAKYTQVLQNLHPSNLRSAKASFQSLRTQMRSVQPYFLKDVASSASPQAKTYFANKARACVEAEKSLSEARLAEIDDIMSRNPQLNLLREDVYRLFVEFFKAVVTDYSHMGIL